MNRYEAGRVGEVIFAEALVGSSFFSGVFEPFFRRNYPVAGQASRLATVMVATVYMGSASGFACWNDMGGKTCGRAIFVAMITMAAPQAGQIIAGGCFRLWTTDRKVVVRNAS